MSRETDLAWAAGFFDGEGTVGLWKNNGGSPGLGRKRLSASVSQKPREPLDHFVSICGGKVNGPYKQQLSPGGVYLVSYGGDNVLALYELIGPYLVAKANKFKEVINEYNEYRATRVPFKTGPKPVSIRQMAGMRS